MTHGSYAAAERFILSREFFGMKLGLENISRFLESIGSPQTAYKTIHIGGTNGKGSVAAMLDAILRAAGYRTGLFTSPHLVDLRERILVNGRMIPRTSVTAFVNRYRKELIKRKLSFFEVVTALAFYYFQRAAIDVAVIEVGLGGRLDATNVLQPLLTVTTDISRDHVEILGSSVRRIAREKGGIIKPGVPHLIGLLPETAEETIQAQCRKQRAPFHRLSRRHLRAQTDRMQFDFRYNGLALRSVSPSLYGLHQLKNGALAAMAATLVNHDGLRITPSAVQLGLEQASWPGRFQIHRRPGRPTIVLDVCHNAGGVAAFVEAFRNRFPDKKAHILTGFVKRKEHQKMFDLLSTIAASYSVVPLNTKRSVDLNELFAVINWRDVPVVRLGSLETAYRHLLRTCSTEDVIAVIGSHFLVGEFFKKFGRPHRQGTISR
ncbi:MAG: folylpolyglutamate synthase/dihydrofolate synthase family protein [Candidatus Zixiibacteriota bacterium]